MTRPSLPLIVFLIACLVAFGGAIWNLTVEASGVSWTLGAWLVVVGTALLVLGGLTVGFARLSRGLRTAVELLIGLALAGFGFAAWLLMAWLVVGALAVAALADLARLIPSRRPPPHPA